MESSGGRWRRQWLWRCQWKEREGERDGSNTWPLSLPHVRDCFSLRLVLVITTCPVEESTAVFSVDIIFCLIFCLVWVGVSLRVESLSRAQLGTRVGRWCCVKALLQFGRELPWSGLVLLCVKDEQLQQSQGKLLVFVCYRKIRYRCELGWKMSAAVAYYVTLRGYFVTVWTRFVAVILHKAPQSSSGSSCGVRHHYCESSWETDNRLLILFIDTQHFYWKPCHFKLVLFLASSVSLN